MIDHLLVRDVTINRPGTRTDRYGTVLPDPDTATTTTTTGWVTTRGSAATSAATREPVDAGRLYAVTTDLILYLPSGTDIAHNDTVTIDTVTYQVDGTPNAAWSPRGEHHIEANLTRADG